MKKFSLRANLYKVLHHPDGESLLNSVFPPNGDPGRLPTVSQWNNIQTKMNMFQKYFFRRRHIKGSYIPMVEENVLIVADILQKMRSPHVIEAGCGSGWFSHHLSKYYPIEPVDNGFWRNRQIIPSPKVHTGDAIKRISKLHSGDAVLSIWPCGRFSEQVLDALPIGVFLIYIGEPLGGSCASKTFFQKANRFYELRTYQSTHYFTSFKGHENIIQIILNPICNRRRLL